MRRQTFFAGAAAAAILAFGLAASLPGESLAVSKVATLSLTSTPLPLNRDDPVMDRIGALRFMGALQIRSTDPLFGGISGMRAGTGMRMLTESDTGNWIAFDTVEQGGRLIGVANGVIAPILRPDGQAAVDKSDGDAEGLEWTPVTGEAIVSYEQDHRLVRFTGIDADRPETLARRPAAVDRIAGAKHWRANGGGEALAVMPGGARIVICEDTDHGDWHEMFVTSGGVTRRYFVEAPADFSPTDAIALDGHRLLVINRYFGPSGAKAALTIVDLDPIMAGSESVEVKATTLASWASPVAIDNMEALAVRRDGARTFVYIASDDNLSSLQRTLLMKFELILGATK